MRCVFSPVMAWWLVLSVCLLAVSVSCEGGGGVAVGMAGRGCFSSVPRGSCGLPLRVRLSVESFALVACLVVCLVAPPHVLVWRCAACVGISCLRFALPQYEYRPVPLVVGAGRYFLSLRDFPVFC